MKSITRLYWNVRWMNISRKWIYEVNSFIRECSDGNSYEQLEKEYPLTFRITNRLYDFVSVVSHWIIKGRSSYAEKRLKGRKILSSKH